MCQVFSLFSTLLGAHSFLILVIVFNSFSLWSCFAIRILSWNLWQLSWHFDQQVTDGYPLVNVYITMEKHHFPMGKSTISMAMFNSYFDITRGYGFLMRKMSVLGAGHYGCRELRSQIFGRTWGGDKWLTQPGMCGAKSFPGGVAYTLWLCQNSYWKWPLK